VFVATWPPFHMPRIGHVRVGSFLYGEHCSTTCTAALPERSRNAAGHTLAVLSSVCYFGRADYLIVLLD